MAAVEIRARSSDGSRAAPACQSVTVERVVALDSLRGLAALAVVLCHYALLLSVTPLGPRIAAWLAIPPLSLLQTAFGSVILFFVLSGYVLALSLIGDERPSWRRFAIRRLCRIWLPFAATILLSFAIGRVLGANPALPAVWRANGWDRDAVTMDALLRQLTMASAHIPLDIPAWSLVIELKVSLFFPLLLLLLRRAPATVLTASFGIALATRCGPVWLAQLLGDSAAYLVYFAVGAWMALNRARLAEASAAAGRGLTGLLGLVALLLLSAPGSDARVAAAAGLGATLIIALASVAPGLARLLAAPWCRFLGQISYSLYLTHAVVLMTLGSLLGAVLSVPAILILAIPAIGLVAWAGYHWVERPAIRLGRRLAAARAA